MEIYLARPISGRSYDEVMKYYFTAVKALENRGFDVLCPMTGKTYLRTELEFKAHGYDEYPTSTNHAIMERDRWMVKKADIIYANLSNSDRVSIGTMMELAWAHDHGKHSIVVMEDGNVHQHAFVLEAADIVFKTHMEAMEYLYSLNAGMKNYKADKEYKLIIPTDENNTWEINTSIDE